MKGSSRGATGRLLGWGGWARKNLGAQRQVRSRAPEGVLLSFD